jgi:hypothetical protein
MSKRFPTVPGTAIGTANPDPAVSKKSWLSKPTASPKPTTSKVVAKPSVVKPSIDDVPFDVSSTEIPVSFKSSLVKPNIKPNPSSKAKKKPAAKPAVKTKVVKEAAAVKNDKVAAKPKVASKPATDKKPKPPAKETVVLGKKAADKVAAVLENPPAPNKKLKEAADKYKATIKTEKAPAVAKTVKVVKVPQPKKEKPVVGKKPAKETKSKAKK